MQLHKVYIIARHEYMVTVRRPGFIILTALVPVLGLLMLLFVLIAGQSLVGQLATLVGIMEQPVGVVDESGYFDPLLPQFTDDFRLFADKEVAFRAVQEGELLAVIIIPSDYTETGYLYLYSPQSSFTQATLLDSYRLRAFLTAHLTRSWVPEDVLSRVAQPLVKLVPLEASPAEASPWLSVTSFVVPYILAILLVISVFVSSGYLIQGLAEEKENRLVEIIISSVTPIDWFVGKVVGLGAAGLTQVGIWLLSSLAISGGAMAVVVAFLPPIPWHRWVLFVVYYVLGYVLYAVLQAGLGALGSTTRETQQIAGLASLVAFIPFMLSSVMFTAPEAPIVRGLSHFPLTAPTMMIMRLAVFDVPTIDIVASLLSITVTIPLAGWFGAKLFRLGILFYGKRPGLAEIWRALRTA